MKKITIIMLALSLSALVFAQNKVKGTVLDQVNNLPVSAVSISFDGKVIAITDVAGNFAIDCMQDKQIIFSKEGYKIQFETIKNCAEQMKITLHSTAQEIPEIEITATSSKEKSLLVQPLSVVKMSEIEIKRGTGIYMNDAINTNVPGVYMQSRANASGQNFNIRGYGNGVRGTNGVNSNFDGQGSKVYLNGILITDAEGITIMDDIDFGSIANIELLKGPSGTLYGLAIAGVVNMQTQKATPNKTAVSSDFLTGSYGLMRSTTRVEIGGAKSSLLINYGKQQFGGYMNHTAAHKDFVNVMGEFVLSPKQTLTTYLGYANSYDERNGELTVQQYESLDYSGNPSYIKNNAHSAIKSLRLGLSNSYKFNDNISNTTSLFGSTQLFDFSSAGGWTDKSSLNYGLRSTFDMNFKLGKKLSLSGIAGVEVQQMNALTNGYKMGADSTNLNGYNVINKISSVVATTNFTQSLFTQWTLHLPKDFNLSAGIGVSGMSIKLEDRMWGINSNHPTNKTPKMYEASYSNMVSPNVSLNKRINNNMSAYVTYSIGYKAPVSSYFYIPTTGQVNSGLKPERGVQLEIGTKGSLFKNKLFYTVALFNAQFQNKMTAVTLQNPANTATLYSYIANGGSLNNNGLELLLKYAVIENGKGIISALRPFANLTYSDFKYKDFRYETIGKNTSNHDTTLVNDFSGNSVAGVPKIVFNMGVDIETKFGVYGNVTYNYRDAMYFTSDMLNQTKSYSLLNAKIGYRKTLKNFTVDVYAGANNITSTQYYYMVFLNQMPDAYLAAPNNINYFGGFNLKYNF